MPKMRNSDTDVGKFVQWMGRKCRNHHPLEELGMTNRDGMPSTYKAKTKADVFTVEGREDVLVYQANGRNFVMKIEEVDASTLEGEKLVAVGY